MKECEETWYILYCLIIRTRNYEIGLWIEIYTEHIVHVIFQSFKYLPLHHTLEQRKQGESNIMIYDEYIHIHTVWTSQILIVLSSEPEHIYLESLDHDMSDIPCVWPLNCCSYFPSRAFHIFIVLSAAV